MKEEGRKVLMMRRMKRELKRMGGLMTIGDLLTGIYSGKYHSFVSGDAWAVAEVIDYPQARVVQIVLVVGTLDQTDVLESQIMAFGHKVGAKFLQAYGRNGWIPEAKRKGWRQRQCIFTKEVAR